MPGRGRRCGFWKKARRARASLSGSERASMSTCVVEQRGPTRCFGPMELQRVLVLGLVVRVTVMASRDRVATDAHPSCLRLARGRASSVCLTSSASPPPLSTLGRLPLLLAVRGALVWAMYVRARVWRAAANLVAVIDQVAIPGGRARMTGSRSSPHRGRRLACNVHVLRTGIVRGRS